MSDKVQVLQAPPGGWWEGRRNEQSGWFPCNHVELAEVPVITERQESTRNSAASQSDVFDAKLFVARASFAARYEDELHFNSGDEIRVVQQPEGGWWEGVCKGNMGWFPANHVVPQQTKPSAGRARLASASGAKPLPPQLQNDINKVFLVSSSLFF